MVENVVPVVTEKPKYDRKARLERLQHQLTRLQGKVTYMVNMSTFGNRFDRNDKCPCKSGKKYKHCCIINHDHNKWRLGKLQWAMDILLKKLDDSGFRIGIMA